MKSLRRASVEGLPAAAVGGAGAGGAITLGDCCDEAARLEDWEDEAVGASIAAGAVRGLGVAGGIELSCEADEGWWAARREKV